MCLLQLLEMTNRNLQGNKVQGQDDSFHHRMQHSTKDHQWHKCNGSGQFILRCGGMFHVRMRVFVCVCVWVCVCFPWYMCSTLTYIVGIVTPLSAVINHIHGQRNHVCGVVVKASLSALPGLPRNWRRLMCSFMETMLHLCWEPAWNLKVDFWGQNPETPQCSCIYI